MKEGIIKFRQEFTRESPIDQKKIIELNLWRKVFYALQLIGKNPDKYDGVAFGNISQQLTSHGNNKRSFLITGTQTGGLEHLSNEHYTTVAEYYPERNLVISHGPIEASSESMSHGALYDLDTSLQFVFHVHSPAIWRNAKTLDIPATKDGIEYGTPQMTEEIKRLFRESDARFKHIIAMGGHEDGILAYGKTSGEAGAVLLKYLAKGFELGRA